MPPRQMFSQPISRSLANLETWHSFIETCHSFKGYWKGTTDTPNNSLEKNMLQWKDYLIFFAVHFMLWLETTPQKANCVLQTSIRFRHNSVHCKDPKKFIQLHHHSLGITHQKNATLDFLFLNPKKSLPLNYTTTHLESAHKSVKLSMFFVETQVSTH